VSFPPRVSRQSDLSVPSCEGSGCSASLIFRANSGLDTAAFSAIASKAVFAALRTVAFSSWIAKIIALVAASFPMLPKADIARQRVIKF
jgi:hypothetical protein